ncbi:MAG: two-component regulator propeller domain-containing protein [Akkermansiaceae bacterium]
MAAGPGLLRRAVRAVLGMLASSVIAVAGASPDYVTKNWEIDDGLPYSSVLDLAQTPDGYLWIGTSLGGLCRFDGVRFTTFDATRFPGMGIQSVRRLFVDSQGNLWVASYGSLFRWENGRFRVELKRDSKAEFLILSDDKQVLFETTDHHLLRGTRRPDGTHEWTDTPLPGHSPAAPLTVDRDGAVWYRNRDGLLGRIAGGREETIRLGPGMEGEKITTLGASPAGEIWIGTGRRLARWNGAGFEDMTPSQESGPCRVERLFFSSHGDLWVHADERLRRWEDRHWVAEAMVRDGPLLVLPGGRWIRSDDRAGFWLALPDQGLLHIGRDGEVRRLSDQEDHPGSLIRCMFTDREDNLWIGYERGGLERVRQRFFDVIGKPEGMADPVTSSVCEDAAGVLWIGTVSGTLSRWQNGECTNLPLPLKGGRCQYLVVCPDPDGRLWIGTTGNGLLVRENGEIRHVHPPEEFKTDVRLMLRTRDGKLWIVGKKSLLCHDHGELKVIKEYEAESDIPASLAEGPDGSLWMGTNGGALVRLAGGDFTVFRLPDPNFRARFWALLAMDDGTIWVGTSGAGLLRFRNGSFERFTRAEGLPSDTFSQIMADDSGNLWLGTKIGIVRMAIRDLVMPAKNPVRPIPYRIFSRSDGLRTTSCALEFQPLCWKGGQGRLWFGMSNGAAGVRPEKVPAATIIPQVIIEDVLVDGANTTPGPAAPNDTELKPVIEVPPGRHEIQFRFTSPVFKSPESVRLRYRLEGLDESWAMSDLQRVVTYHYVPPGKYIFQVQACDGEGIWNEAGAALTLIARPHVWETVWFPFVVTISAMLAASGLAILVTRARQRRKLAEIKFQRTLERDRARVAQDLHDDLGAGLAEIGLLGSLAMRPATAPDATRGHLHQITAKCRDLVTSLDEIVWAVNPKHDTATSLSSYLCDYAQQFLKPAMIDCRLDVAKNIPAVQLDSNQRHSIFLAFKESLTNVVRHSQAGAVVIRISVGDGELNVAVEDNGNGLVNPAAETADGLINMSERLKNLGGRCVITSGPSGGTSVHFLLPITGTPPP